MTRVKVTGLGYFDSSGIGGSSADAARPPIGVDDLSWQNISTDPFKRFGQLDAVSKCAVAAVEVGQFAARTSPDTAICAATNDGCLGADIEFYQSAAGEAGASPRLFAYTLPSTVCGEIAIRYGWMGSAICLVTPNSLDALFEAYHLVASGESPSSVALGYDGTFARTAETAQARGLARCHGTAQAHAFLLQQTSDSGGWTLSDHAPNGDKQQELKSLRDLKDFLLNSALPATKLEGTGGQSLYLVREHAE